MERPLFLDLTNSLALLFLCALAQSACFIITPDGLSLPPLAATGVLILIGLVFIARYIAPAGGAAQIERRARSRVRPLGAQWPWSGLTAIAVTFFLLALLSVYMRLVPQTDNPGDTTEQYAAMHLGMIPIVVAAVFVGPLIEEVIMRGWIQGRLSREFGPESAIVNTAALFAVAHLDPWGVAFLFPLGLACGYSVYLTRSIWSGVLIHVMFNGSLFLVDHFFPAPDAFPALSAGVEGSMRMGSVMAVSATIAVVAWRQQRVIRDRMADDAAEEPGGALDDTD
jgi:membrane protease YdiL (CAAX protease family)